MEKESRIPNVLTYFPKSVMAGNLAALLICLLDAFIFYLHDYRSEIFSRWSEYTSSISHFLKTVPAVKNVIYQMTTNPKIYATISPFFGDSTTLIDAIAINAVAHVSIILLMVFSCTREFGRISSDKRIFIAKSLYYWEWYSIILFVFCIIIEYSIFSGAIYTQKFLGLYPLRNYYIFLSFSFLIFYMTQFLSITGTAIYLSKRNAQEDDATESGPQF